MNGFVSRVRKTLSYRELRLRKWTTPIHWFFGGVCGYILVKYGYPIGVLIGAGFLVLFGVFEFWNDYCLKKRCPSYLPEGDEDWWESFLVCFVVIVIYVMLDSIGIVSLNW